MSAADHIEFLSRRIAELDERIAAAREYGPEFRALTKRRSIYIADRALLMRATLAKKNLKTAALSKFSMPSTPKGIV